MAICRLIIVFLTYMLSAQGDLAPSLGVHLFPRWLASPSSQTGSFTPHWACGTPPVLSLRLSLRGGAESEGDDDEDEDSCPKVKILKRQLFVKLTM